MIVLRTAARVLASLLAGAAVLLAAAPPAAAGLPVLAQVSIDILYTTSSPSFSVCVSGQVDDGTTILGEWVFEIDGARSDGTPIHHTISVSGPTYSRPCEPVAKNGTEYGAFEVSLSFVAAGTSDVTTFATGAALWSPSTGNVANSFEF